MDGLEVAFDDLEVGVLYDVYYNNVVLGEEMIMRGKFLHFKKDPIENHFGQPGPQWKGWCLAVAPDDNQPFLTHFVMTENIIKVEKAFCTSDNE